MADPIQDPIGTPMSGSYLVTPPPLTPLYVPNLFFDSLGPSSTVSSEITIIAFSHAVTSAIDQLKQQLGEDAYQQNIQGSRFYEVVLNRALYLMRLLLSAFAAINSQKNLLPIRNQQVKDVNIAINAYNLEVSSLNLGNTQAITAVKDLYAGITAFIDPSSFNYLNQIYIQQIISDYATLTGADMTDLSQAFADYQDPLSPNFNDYNVLGTAFGQFLSQFTGLVNTANQDFMEQAWYNYFDVTHVDYLNLPVLDSAIKSYAPFLDPGYSTVSPPGAPITEQSETARVNQAISDYNNPISSHYQDAAYLALIFAQYDAYRQGSLATPISALNTYLADLTPTQAELNALTTVLQTFHRYIVGAPDILTSINTYNANPTPANLVILKNDLTNYRNYLNTNPQNFLNRNADITTVNAAIAIYQSFVDANNAKIDAINQVRLDLGLSQIQKQPDVPPQPMLPPPPSITDGSILLDAREPHDRVALFKQPPLNDTAIQTALDNAFKTALIFFSSIGRTMSGAELDIKFLQYIFNGIALANPLGLEKIVSATPTTNPAPSVGFGTTALNLSSPFVEAVVSSSMLQAFFKNAQIPDTPAIMNAIKVATLQFVNDLSLLAGGGAVTRLSNALPNLSLLAYRGIDEAAANVFFAVEFANQVSNFFSSDIPQEAIQQILNTSPSFGNLSPDMLAELSGGISSALAASIGVVALSNLSIALGTPGFTAQLLSLIPGIQTLDSNVLSPPIFADFVNNGLTSSLVGNLLIGSGLDASASGQLLRDVLGSGSPDAFFATLQAALLAGGVSPEEARRLSLSATSLVLQQGNQNNFTQAELDKVLMDGVIDKQALTKALGSEELAQGVIDRLNTRNQIANSVLQASISEDFRLKGELVARDIRSNLINDSVIRDQIQRDAETQDAIRDDITLRDVRDAIRDEEIANGESIEAADVKARAAIDAIREDEDLNNRLELAFVDQEVLKNSIEHALIIRGIQERDAINRAEIIAEAIKNDRENFANRNNFRAAIKTALVDQGIDSPQASLIAAGIDLGIQKPDLISLFNIGKGPLTLYEIAMDLETRISALFGGRLSAENTDKLLDRLKDTVIEGDNSLVRLIDRSLLSVAKVQNKEVSDALSDHVSDLVKPTKEIYAFMDKVRDPGNALIYSVWSGIMYGGGEPSNYKRDLDVMV